MLKDQPAPTDDSESRPVLLAIDTSTEYAGIALHDGSLIAEYIWKAGRSHTTSLLPAISRLLEHNNYGISEVSGLAVAIGPGAFTGLRVGLSVAKGLVLAHNLPLIGIPTLAVAAKPVLDLGHDVLAVIPAGRGRFVWAIYRQSLTTSPQPVNGTRAELDTVIVAHPDLVVTGEWDSSTRRPSVLAELAWQRWQHNDIDDPSTLQAIYIHGRPPGSPPDNS